MLSLNPFSLFELLCICIIAFIIISKMRFNTYTKLLVYMFFAGFVIYSGVGICDDTVSNLYFLPFFLFLISFPFGVFLAQKTSEKFRTKDMKFVDQDMVLKIAFVIYWLSLIIRLVYPINHIPQLFHPNLSLIDREPQDFNIISSLTTYVLLLFKPIYYGYLYKKCSTIKTVLLLVLELYIQIVTNGYIARSGFIAQVLVILLVLVTKHYENKNKDSDEFVNKPDDNKSVRFYEKGLFKKYRKLLFASFVIIVILLPILYEYTNYRLGMAHQTVSASIKINRLLSIELGFPKLYDYCQQYHGSTNFGQYLVYVLTLIIPKRLFGIENAYDINAYITTAYSGLKQGMMGYSVYLSGLLGEGIMLIGTAGSWLFGLFLGYLLGIIFSFTQKYKVFTIWVIYLCVNVLLMCRGGSQYSVSTFINGSFLLFVFSLFDRYRIVFRSRR